MSVIGRLWKIHHAQSTGDFGKQARRLGKLGMVRPLLFARPTGLSFGLVPPGTTVTRVLTLTDAGDGAGSWTTAQQTIEGGKGVRLSLPDVLTVPGKLTVAVTVSATAPEGEASGFVFLGSAGGDRRIAYWLRVTRPRLVAALRTAIAKPGVFSGDTRGKAALVSRYRYPDSGPAIGVPTHKSVCPQYRLRKPLKAARPTMNRVARSARAKADIASVKSFGTRISSRAPRNDCTAGRGWSVGNSIRSGAPVKWDFQYSNCFWSGPSSYRARWASAKSAYWTASGAKGDGWPFRNAPYRAPSSL